MIIVVFIVLSVAFTLVYIYLTWNFNYWRSRGLAGPKPQIIYGNFPSVITGKGSSIYEMDDIYNQYKMQESAVGVFMTRIPEIMILDPKVAQDVMVTNFRKYHDNMSSRYVTDKKQDKIAARSPFFTTGDDWKTKRSDVLAGLTLNKLNMAYPIWLSSAQKLGNYIEEYIEKGIVELNIKDLANRFTAHGMADFLWGIDAGTFSNTSSPNTIISMSQKILTQAMAAIDFYFLLNLASFLRPLYKCRVFPSETDAFFSKLMKDAIELRRKNMTLRRSDNLDYLMQLQEKNDLSHDDIVGHTMAAWLDGFETSANALYHTMFYLSHHPEAQEKLRDEILENLGEQSFLTFDQLNNMPYLEQCIYETLRLVTPVSTFSRICTEDSTLEVESGRRIPIQSGIIFIIPVFSYHHDPEFFPNPYEYNPNRFDNKAHIDMTKQGILMPFGDGPRICIGKQLGLLEVKTGLVEILKQYRLRNCAKTMAAKKPDSKSFIFGLEGEFWLSFEKI